MDDNDFASLKAGLEDAIAFARGDTSRGVVHMAVDIKAIREAAGKSQAEFAEAYGLPVRTVQEWEQGRRVPDAPARALLTAISRDPATMERLLAPKWAMRNETPGFG